MKKLFLTLLTGCVAFGSQGGVGEELLLDVSEVVGATDGQVQAASLMPSMLVIFRPRFSPPLAFKPIITISGRQAALLPPAHHLKLSLRPGEYEVLADWGRGHGVGDTRVDLVLEPGETTYVRITNRMSFPISGHASSELNKVEVPDLAKSALVVSRQPGWYVKNELLPAYVLPPYSVDDLVQRISRGIRSEQRQVAREIVKLGVTDGKVLAALASQLAAVKGAALTESLDVDAVAWMSRALAVSADEKYLPDLQALRDGAANKKVRRYAKKFIRRYYGRGH